MAEYEASDDARAAFERALTQLGTITEPPERRMSTEEKSELAMERAGTRDKSSRAYKSARRTVERHATTTARQVRGQPLRRLAEQIRRRGLRVSADVEIDPSPDPDEPDKRPRSIEERLSGDDCRPLAAALDRGDMHAAADEFWQALLREYEEVGPDEHSFLAGAAQDLDVSGLSIELG